MPKIYQIWFENEHGNEYVKSSTGGVWASKGEHSATLVAKYIQKLNPEATVEIHVYEPQEIRQINVNDPLAEDWHGSLSNMV